MMVVKEDMLGYAPKREDKVPASRPRTNKKKPKDKPKRPLSAYNFFFKEEREKILKVVLAEDPDTLQPDKEASDYLDEAAIGRLRKEKGKVSFEEMGKIIGFRWKNIDPDRLSRYSELASGDTDRYKAEMKTYNKKQGEKMRAEAMKPQQPSAVTTSTGISNVVSSDGSVSRNMAGYPSDNMAAMHHAAAYGMPPMMQNGYGYPGMDYTSGYNMGNNMYAGAYGAPGAMGGYPSGVAGGNGATMGTMHPSDEYHQHPSMYGGMGMGSPNGYHGGGEGAAGNYQGNMMPGSYGAPGNGGVPGDYNTGGEYGMYYNNNNTQHHNQNWGQQ